MIVNRMNQNEFAAVWATDKSIVEEIRFRRSKQATEVYEFDRVEVLANFPGQIWVHGSYNCRIGCVAYTFWIEGVGSVVRYCMGGPEHGNAGRFHYHEMRRPSDPRQNLPYVEARPEMEGLTSLEIWKQVCVESHITHTDKFFEPEFLCR